MAYFGDGVSLVIADIAARSSEGLWKIAARKLEQLDSITSIQDLRIAPGNRLKPLSGDRKGQYSIRINDQYRICFTLEENEPSRVEINDYH